MQVQRATPNRLIAAAVFIVGALLAGAATAEAAPAAPVLKVTSTEDVLGLSSRLVFSTVKAAATPARSVTVANTGNAALKITGLTITGANPGQFKLRSGQATVFTVNPGRTATVGVLFKPTATGVKSATLTVKNNDKARPNYAVALRGVNAVDAKGKNEASLASIVSTLGYTTKVGFSTVQQAMTRTPVGDEVIAPYFRRVDPTRPVRLVPVARYVFAANPSPSTGYQPVQGSASAVDLFTFPNDVLDTPGGADTTVYVENEKTLPTIAAGGTTSFEPTAPFAISAEGAASTDDQPGPRRRHHLPEHPQLPGQGQHRCAAREQLDPRSRHEEHGRQELRLPGHRPPPHERHARPHQGPGIGVARVRRSRARDGRGP